MTLCFTVTKIALSNATSIIVEEIREVSRIVE